MVNTAAQLSNQTPLLLSEKRVVFHNLTWHAYEQILNALPESRSTRLTYYCGTLEITMPLEDHEFSGRMIELFIHILVEELDMEIKIMGSTTLKYPDLDRSPEPDNAYYIQNQSIVAGKTVNFDHDPPPDLVVEVDITYSDIDKNALYSGIGVPELWRFNGREIRFYLLENQQYIEVEVSPTFPSIPKTRLYEFLEQCRTGEVRASKTLRNWMQARRNQ
jgi:Uma2 family endonuclease